MLYIRPSEESFYTPPQSLKAKGLINFPEEFLDEFNAYNGFVTLNVENNTVVSLTPNTEAWEEWKVSIPPVEPEKPKEDGAGDNDVVTWAELDAAYNEGRDAAYDS